MLVDFSFLDITRIDPSDLVVNDSIIIIIMFALFIQNLRKSSGNVVIVWISYFCGTILHELAHLFVAILLNGKPRGFHVFPKKVYVNENNEVSVGNKSYKNLKSYWILGSVDCINLRWYNTIFISIAPLLLIPLAFFM